MSIKIPQNGKFSQPNNSDLFGNIWYTKNMNFDEEGYIKLSSRTALLLSEKDNGNFNLPVSFGRTSSEYHIVTTDSPFDASAITSDYSIAEDVNTNAPTLTTDSDGEWFNNRWHASTATKVWYTTGADWTDTALSLTTGKVHALARFPDKVGLAVANGNTVQLVTTAYANIATLTLPTDYEIVNMVASGGLLGIVTKLSDTIAGQNQDTYFFTWDGNSGNPNSGVPIGSDVAEGICAYMSSFLILTRAGELKYFNGGGFEILASFPFYFSQTTLGDSTNRDFFGKTMMVDGSVVYINVANPLSSFGYHGEQYLQNFPAGVWCYDPKVGLYHKYSPSISQTYQISVLSAGVDTTADILTATSGTLPTTGSPIKQIGDDTIGIGIGDVYYIIKHTSTTFSLAESKQDALDGNKVDITTANNVKFIGMTLTDYGTSLVNHAGGLVQPEAQTRVVDHMLIGSQIQDIAATTNYGTLCLTMPKFKNIGYFVTAKVVSQGMEDNSQKVFIKYRPLDTEDSIVIKIKDKDIIGIPTSSPQLLSGSNSLWTDSTTFTTTSNLSSVLDYLNADSNNECEVEIIGGAGAGQASQIHSITESSGTYTVMLVDEIEGASNGRYCEVSIDNWKLLKTKDDESALTSANTNGWSEFPITSSSKWFKFKVQLTGSETTIEELQIINATQIASA